MGAAATFPIARESDPPEILYIHDKLRGKKKGFGFARSMFSKLEWRTLKKFCVFHNVSQLDLNRVYTRYLSTDAAVVRKMRVLIADIGAPFAAHSPIYQDMVEVMFPGLFLRSFTGLKEPYSSTEISFARFIILGYTTCSQPISDLIFDFFSISRRSMNIKVVATIFAYNLKQIVKVFTSELSNSAARRFLVEKCIGEDDEEMTILSVMQLGVKYPLLFFQLFLFQRHLKRLIFGDRFWEGRPLAPSRFIEEGLSYDPLVFKNEKYCIKETARQILFDFANAESSVVRLYPTCRDDISQLTVDCCTRAKTSLGYRWARDLIEESELDYPQEQCFADVPADIDNEVRIYDHKIQSDFVYNVGTGYRAWVEQHKLRSGEVIKELWHRTGPDL